MTTNRRRRTPPAYKLAVAILRPPMMLLTKQDWSGQENFPTEGGFIVSPNHLSYADPIPFAHFLYDSGYPPYFLAKEGIFKLPVAGAIVRKADQIPVYRNTGKAVEAFRAALRAIEDGKTVVMYPEGTITRDPELWPMVGKTGAARVALTTKAPLIPVGMWGPQEVLAPYATKPHLFPRKTMHLKAGPAVDLGDLYDRPMDQTVLRGASDRIISAITALVEELRGEPAPAERFDSRKAGLPPTGNFHKQQHKGPS